MLSGPLSPKYCGSAGETKKERALTEGREKEMEPEQHLKEGSEG